MGHRNVSESTTDLESHRELLEALPLALAFMIREARAHGLEETAHFLACAMETVPAVTRSPSVPRDGFLN